MSGAFLSHGRAEADYPFRSTDKKEQEREFAERGGEEDDDIDEEEFDFGEDDDEDERALFSRASIYWLR